MCAPLIPYIPYIVAGVATYMATQSANQKAQDQNDRYNRNAMLAKQNYMNTQDRLREERLRVGKASKVEAEKFSDATIDQKRQLLEATGSVEVRSGEGTGELNSLLLGINRQGLTNLNRIESTFGTTTQNLRSSLKNIEFKGIDAQNRTMMQMEQVAKARGPSLESQLVNYATASAKAYSFSKEWNDGGSDTTTTGSEPFDSSAYEYDDSKRQYLN